MTHSWRKIQRIYLMLLLFNTLAASFIWGINTIFLLDAGLNNAQAFAANAFFTAGMLVFEIPTGVIADLKGRRMSYLLGVVTLSVSTALYYWMWHISAPFWGWAVASIFLGLGFTFFSGATQAWLVDALKATGFKGNMETVFAKGQIIEGIGMLSGSVAGGIIAQSTNLGVPYLIRAFILALTFILAYIYMHDLGFKPASGKHPAKEINVIFHQSIQHGLRKPSVRWIMLTAPFMWGVTYYVFYALQPYLLELYGDPNAYSIAGLTAAIVAGAQIAGGILAPRIGRLFRQRTSLLIVGTILTTVVLLLTGMVMSFWLVIILMVIWGMLFAAMMPVRQAYLNSLIPSKQRATVLSFDSLLGSSGGVVAQPVLGRAADVWGYPASYLMSAAFQAIAIPFSFLARKHHDKSADEISRAENPVVPDK